MILDSLLLAHQRIPLHAIAALAAMVLGGLQLWGPKGTRNHRTLGYIWVGLTAIVAFSGFFIHVLKLVGPFSPIHLLFVLTLASLWYTIRVTRRGDIKQHRQTMVALFWMALILTGFLTFWRGRVMYQVVTGA